VLREIRPHGSSDRDTLASCAARNRTAGAALRDFCRRTSEAIDGVVTGCEFTPYLPFILFSAILLRWWKAGAVALASVAIHGVMFVGPPSEFLVSQCFLSSAGIFLISSALMIGAVMVIRRVAAAMLRRDFDESAGGIVFSLQNDEVWASWYGAGPPMRLGSQNRVEIMMEDFLAQGELGKRLTQRSN